MQCGDETTHPVSVEEEEAPELPAPPAFIALTGNN